jgi:hypothetical protein
MNDVRKLGQNNRCHAACRRGLRPNTTLAWTGFALSELLDQVAARPLSTWNYKSQDAAIQALEQRLAILEKLIKLSASMSR